MRLCITGAGGFAGSYLMELLVREGHEVHGILSPRNNRNNLTSIADRIFLYPVDLQDAAATEGVLDTIRPEGVFHLASYAIPSQSFRLVREVLQLNPLVTINLFEALRVLKLQCRVICISSVDVYRIGSDELLAEEKATGPSNPYGISKYTQELLCQYYGRVYNLHSIRLRPFLFIGPRQKPVFAIPSFCRQMVRIERGIQNPMIEVGNIDVIRDYSDVRDIVKGFLQAFSHGRDGEVYNLCSGKGVALREILTILLSYTTIPVKIEINPGYLRPFDVPRIVGNNNKARQELNWLPKIQLATTLQDMLGYWRTSNLA